ncbi:MAG: hypothetical protein A3J07_02650 [Candidatus Doudnabacteria bacterium RIFCSPLOWO2_02_FULL_49_13]|uniref:Glycosyl transferase n=1 Tax=Candidatus Doudnabacteria bacterium RIFCSPHIGHO2_12_FULL_48_16 TaxID=1817838 RepID=A0A1F5PKW1_9BACT|nr:MAG: hypothetical protein A3E29_02165 [Candidatus Doudnabacteria bacterium RIFCSPHIGHO2_12_FULL_48_16]OGE97615.1 MAG: hypothetical protein A2990_03220 [Candidatus Doudnabacteria bacterium RIFCSPLOWO2_01_FULL_49_40]OGF02970.1 MAG: hypothetical protein A3J07_02650 [Candidatus Doudnabacteria bacterium RIFCSPLOWO2_02_FULL_49_13]
MKSSIAGVLVDNITKHEAIEAIDNFVKSGQPHSVVTPYSELIVWALDNSSYRNILNNADLSLPDGVGILWAAKYLSSPKVGLWRSLLSIIFDRPYIRSVIQEQISGSRFIYDIAELAEEKNYSLSLVGGSGNVAAQSAYELKKLFSNLNIKLALSGRPFDAKIVEEISRSNSDILLIAYSPPKQEIWLSQNLPDLNVRVAMGVGGSFDYIAKKHPVAPSWAKSWGLEWFWRLITQPWRLKRIWNAVPMFIWKIYKYKKYARSSN